MFNFDFDSTSAVSNSKKRLNPWDIYKVKFNGCEIREFDRKSDPTQHYKVLQVNFEGDDGYYSESIFFPKDGDTEVKEYPSSNGGTYKVPSNWDRTKYFIAQLATVLNPEGFKKMCSMTGKFKTFDDMCKALITITDPKKGTEIELKLVGKTKKDGTVEACLPKFVAYNKEGQLFVSDNFIGKNLFFSPWEEGKRAQFKNAKPTPVEDITILTEDKVEGLDLSSLYE